MLEAEKFGRRGEGDKAAGFKKSDARSKKQSFAEVVSDEDDGFAEAAGEGKEFTLELGASDGIECAKGLIHEKNRRIGGESASDTDALALTAGEFVGTAVGKLGGIEADESEQLPNADGGAATVPLFEGREQSDVFGDGEMREKASLLNDVADATAKADGVGAGRGAAGHEDLTLRGKQQAIDEFEESGFAAAAAAEEDEGLGRRDG